MDTPSSEAPAFDAQDVLERLDELLVDVRELRAQVHELSVNAATDGAPRAGTKSRTKKTKTHKKHKKKTKQQK